MRPLPAVIPTGNRTYAVITLAVIFICAFVAVYYMMPPSPVPASAPADVFSAERAFVHIEATADDIHPIGTQNNAGVRDYLIQAVDDMGLVPIFQDAYVGGGRGSKAPYLLADAKTPYEVSRVQNVIARVEGTLPEDERKAVLLMAHYDGTPYGPGAADDITGVAAILETLRALKNGPPLKHDVIGLMTDGEEAGLLGPRAFSQHPWYDRVAFCINFEARGHYGPSLMFQVTDDNYWLIREVAQASDSVTASSTMFDVAKRMPTRSDFWVLREEGFQGIDVAFIGGIKYYHTMNDSPEKLSLASVQNHGNYGLQISRHLASSNLLADVERLDLNNLEGDNAVYFNSLGKHLVYYPVSWTQPMLYGLAAFVALVLLTAWLRGYITLPGILGGLALQLAVIVAAAAVSWVFVVIAFWWQSYYIVYSEYRYLIAFLALNAAFTTFAYGWALKRASAASLFSGSMLVWLGLLAGCTFYVSGATFAAFWPLLSMSLAVFIVVLLGRRISPFLRALILLAGSVFPILLLAPNIYLFFMGLLIVGAPAYMALMAAGVGLLSPLLALLGPDGRSWVVRAGTAVGIVFLILGYWGVSFTPDTPKMNMLCYGVNWDEDTAYWISTDEKLDRWMKRYFQDGGQYGTIEEFGHGGGRVFRKEEAPVPTFAKPEIEMLRDEAIDGVREVEFRLHTPRLPEYVWMSLPEEVKVLETHFNGEALQPPDRGWRFRYQGIPQDDGLHFTLRIEGEGPVPMVVREESSGLPPIEGVPMTARPANMITENNVIRHFRGGPSSNRVWSRITLTLLDQPLPQ